MSPLEQKLRQLADAVAMRGPQVGAGKRIRQETKPLMNGLETDFLKYLESAYAGFRIVPQGMRVKIASGAWFKVDFFIPAKLAAFVIGMPFRHVMNCLPELKIFRPKPKTSRYQIPKTHL